MSGRQHLGQCGDDFGRRLTAAIKATRGFTSESAAINCLATRLDVGRSAVLKAMREIGAVFVIAKRPNVLPVHIHLLRAGEVVNGRAA